MCTLRRALTFAMLLPTAPLLAQQSPAPAPLPPVAAAPAASVPTGRVTGRVIDRESGRPLQGARVSIIGIPGAVETDLDGRYRTPSIPAGIHSVRAAFIGYQATLRDSVRVVAGQAVTVDFVMTVQIVELEDLAVEATVLASPKSDAGLLAAQQAAAGVSDGISAEAISRSPDSDGGDVIRRVTGVAVFDKKFVIVRGLNERYSNTTLNGSDLPSPEPLKKVAQLDIFPASLLESIVTAKTATPDKPGDFAGGLVEVRTKEFPENFQLQFGLTQGFNSQSTFRRFAQGPRTGSDLLGFGDSHRRPFGGARPTGALTERQMESFRNVWTGEQREALPNFGFSANMGGQVGETTPFGFVVAVTYNNRRNFTPDKLLAYVQTGNGGTGKVLDESVNEVEWGGIANFSFRPTGGTKIGLKNLFTRSAEETFSSGSGYNTESGAGAFYNIFGVGYIERELRQTQLSGEHLLGFLWGSRFEWKGTIARATRKEPDQRQARYNTGGGATVPALLSSSGGGFAAIRDLRDRVRTGQADLSIPWSLRREDDATFKFGGLLRDKPRKFTADQYDIQPFNAPGSGVDESITTLAPERAFAPENVGPGLLDFTGGAGNDYESDDDLTAAYGMVDVPILPSVRLVTGVRMEHWRLTIYKGNRTLDSLPVFRRPYDWLWSANLTFSLSDQMNLRFAGFRSVTRPDPRELVVDRYNPVGTECQLTGDPLLQDAKILNGDARWEYYPRSGEIFAVSGFYKRFTRPLVETIQQAAADCTVLTANGKTARVYGLELEARRSLDFLPGFFRDFTVGVNATLINSEVALDPVRFGPSAGLGLQGQSPLLLNASLTYTNPDWGTSVSALYNYFDTRIARYGGVEPSVTTRVANVLEKGRYSLDAKVQQNVGPVRMSLSVTNITNQRTLWVVEGTNDRAVSRRSRSGTSVSLGMNYDVF
ncbi:MAG: carboxypeptidase regulatory-like domain-containing protein [Gemmatimonadota bacterium]|nr:carboxypeptidase regulatory-like domain-containing protein [Gemmatimonadota bacterium]